MKDKIFVGKVWDAKWSIAKLDLKQEDLDLLQANMQNGKVSVLIKESKKNTKYAEIDTWVSTTNGQNTPSYTPPAPVTQAEIPTPPSDLPF